MIAHRSVKNATAHEGCSDVEKRTPSRRFGREPRAILVFLRVHHVTRRHDEARVGGGDARRETSERVAVSGTTYCVSPMTAKVKGSPDGGGVRTDAAKRSLPPSSTR
jgi:hypothetical protein